MASKCLLPVRMYDSWHVWARSAPSLMYLSLSLDPSAPSANIPPAQKTCGVSQRRAFCYNSFGFAMVASKWWDTMSNTAMSNLKSALKCFSSVIQNVSPFLLLFQHARLNGWQLVKGSLFLFLRSRVSNFFLLYPFFSFHKLGGSKRF